MSTIETDNFELYPDPTKILTLPLDEPEEILTEEEEIIKEKKIKALKCKIIALSDLDLHPILTNVSTLPFKKKNQLIKLVEDYFEKDIEEIDKLFNIVVNTEILNNESDHTNYPIFKRSYKLN